MDSHETDSKLSRNLKKLTEQVAIDRSVDADSTLNSCANTNEYKSNEPIRDHNVPDNSQQSQHAHQSRVQYTRSTSMSGDVDASTSEQDICSTGISSRKSKQRKSDSTSSSPAMSPSYIQNKQYRTNMPRNVDLIDNVMHLNDNKENVPGIHAQYGSSTEHRLDSPKFALQQNSPITPLSSYKSPPSTHSSPMYTAHEPRTDCNIFTYSPLITEPFKNSTYFHFPDVDTPSPLVLASSQEATRAQMSDASSFSTLNNNNVIMTIDDKKNNQATLINNNNNNNNNRSNYSSNNLQVTGGECCSGASKGKAKEAAVRRARLKSISLDSDGARLVEENLRIPVEELMERALAQTTSSFDEDTPFHSPTNLLSSEHQSHSKCFSKNINHLVLDLSIKDDSLPHVDYQSSPSDTKEEHFKFSLSKSKSTTPKTPTLTQIRQKAISLDSDPKYKTGPSDPRASTDLNMHHAGNHQLTIMRNKPHLMSNFLCIESNASMSVPTTPRRQPIVKNTLTKLNSNSSKGCGNRKTTFASSAEYFASKKAIDRKCNDKMQMNSETEPILEGTVVEYYDDVYAIEHENTSSFEASTDDVDCDIISGSANSLISHCGTSTTNNHNNNNSGNNFLGLRSNMSAAGLSLSNYSLSNFQGSHCSLTRSNYNIFGLTTAAANTSSQNVPKASAAPNKCVTSASQSHQPMIMNSANMLNSRSNFCVKKNLLQRRGSNTSLTLNIVGGTNNTSTTMQSSLNRFNSHNSLNVMSTPFDIQRGNSTLATAKKGLLERRNSNASLTLQLECRSNIQKRALSTSNCYLRGSDLSLSSSSNHFESHLEEHRICTKCGGGGALKTKSSKRSTSASGCNSESRRGDPQYEVQDDSAYAREENEQISHPITYVDDRPKQNRSGRRKFFSSENLNLQNAFSLSQPPTKTSSVVDLNQTNSEMEDVYDDQGATYCPCSTSIIRNITTKPLSPQTTSEDFKIYLANIQILQNASNVLTDQKLTTFSNVFNRSYGRSAIDDLTDKACDACETCTVCKTCTVCLTKCRCEQNCLLTNLHQEFWDLPTNYQEKPLVFGSQVKNRYKTILPNEHSRVILDAEIDPANQSKEQPTSELYINANYIKGPDYTQNSYIATQGPMTNTIYDFWLMVFQNYRKNLKASSDNVDALPFQQKIAMLTDIIENDESKCAIYFPHNIGNFMCFLSNEERRHEDCQQSQSTLESFFAEHEDEWSSWAQPNEIHSEVIGDNWPDFPMFNFNFFCIKTVDCINKGGYAIRKLICLYHTFERLDAAEPIESDEAIVERKAHLFVVYHYWFPHWPDHRSPENVDIVLDMCINLIDSDCEQEISNAQNDLASDAAIMTEDVDDSVRAFASNELQMSITQSMPMTLNQAPFNGAIPVIHCSAGIGRTGCVVAILNGLRQLRLSYLSSSTSSSLNTTDSTKHASVDVLGIVSNLRLQRGGMIQNSEQYEMVHRALCLYHQRYLSK